MKSTILHIISTLKISPTVKFRIVEYSMHKLICPIVHFKIKFTASVFLDYWISCIIICLLKLSYKTGKRLYVRGIVDSVYSYIQTRNKNPMGYGVIVVAQNGLINFVISYYHHKQRTPFFVYNLKRLRDFHNFQKLKGVKPISSEWTWFVFNYSVIAKNCITIAWKVIEQLWHIHSNQLKICPVFQINYLSIIGNSVSVKNIKS